jgi:hypothetical protein
METQEFRSCFVLMDMRISTRMTLFRLSARTVSHESESSSSPSTSMSYEAVKS